MHPPIVLRDAAFWYDERLHQVAAWDYLQQHTPPDVLSSLLSSIAQTQAWLSHPPGFTENDLASVFTDTTRVFDG